MQCPACGSYLKPRDGECPECGRVRVKPRRIEVRRVGWRVKVMELRAAGSR